MEASLLGILFIFSFTMMAISGVCVYFALVPYLGHDTALYIASAVFLFGIAIVISNIDTTLF